MSWQLIGTAPKDGTPVILRYKWCNENDFLVAYWSGSDWELCGLGPYICYDQDGFDKDFEPTHWRPIQEFP